MINYEAQLLEIAPWLREISEFAKTYNNNSFMRGRTGWIERDIKNPESIFEHSCKVALAAHFLFGTKKSIDMAFIHDFGELLTPDYIPGEVDRKYKEKQELEAMQKIKKNLTNGDYWFELWEEFESKKGIAFYISELDKICPSIQAINYSNQGYKNYNLEEFQPFALKRIQTLELKKILEEFNINYVTKETDTYSCYFKKLKELNLEIS
jgi:5'-deoxynucleotidase YfbR-like HD superfamily hydrolase